MVTNVSSSAIENGPWTWQSGQFYSTTTLGYTPFYRFCDYVEVSIIRFLPIQIKSPSY